MLARLIRLSSPPKKPETDFRFGLPGAWEADTVLWLLLAALQRNKAHSARKTPIHNRSMLSAQ